MGAFYIRDNIQCNPRISELSASNNAIVTFTYTLNGVSKVYNCYCTTREDYEVSIEVVDRAIQSGHNLITYDSWIFPTLGGVSYAQTQGINVYSATDLISKIRKGEDI